MNMLMKCATLMNNVNDVNERRWMEWSVMRWDGAVVILNLLTGKSEINDGGPILGEHLV